ncbi:MAG: FAD:protein FMN transferase [bacterium]|nr:FAD:protein FMN transferase [Candidatus Aquidulcis sp.]
MSGTLDEPITRVVRKVFGTAASLAVVGPLPSAAVEATFARLNEIEDRFSTYRPNSEICRIRDGVLTRAAAHPETQQILDVCEALHEESGGIFDAWHAGRDGGLEPAGYVKGWAIGVAGALLREHGVENFSFGIGGDITASGGGPAGIGWSVGVVDPRRATTLVARVALRDAAIATSGQSERPGHLRDSATGGSTTSPWLSFTVVGPDIARVDALATICFLEGRAGMQRVDQEPGYGALAMDSEGVLTATAGFRARTI